jgi:hypothetical protein
MARHLADDTLLRALEEGTDDEVREHLEVCALCRGRVSEAKEGLELARSVSAPPEPSPLYWETLRRQVDGRIAEEKAPGWWRGGIGLRWLLPAVAAAALLFVALPTRRSTETPEAVLPPWDALPSSSEDAGLDVLRAVALGGSDLEAAAPCRDLVDCVSVLSDEELTAVAEALRSELPEGRS